MNTELTQEEFEIIEDYLQNNLKEAELIALEHQVKNDPRHQAKIKELQLIQLAIAERSLETDLETFYTHQNIKKVRKKKSYRIKITSIAASIAVIIGFAIYYFVFQNNQTLYGQYYKPDPGLITAMGSSDQYDFQKAMVEYKNGDYDPAIQTWRSQLKTDAQNDTLMYFLGAAYQAKGITDSAEFYLFKVASIPENAFYSEANWYLGLLKIENKQKDLAIEYLKKSNHSKKEELIQLINKK